MTTTNPADLDGGGDLTAFLAARPELDLATVDLAGPDAHERLALPAGSASAGLLAKLRARQRMWRVAGDTGAADTLIAAGFDSAHRIAVLPEHRFVREHADLFGGDTRAARQAHRRATAVKAAVGHLYANLHGTIGSPHFAALHGNAVAPDLTGYFAGLPSYQDLFGSLDHVPCPHCGSVFGPAAYLTDLLRVADDYITAANPGIPAGYRLHERRPDLFDTPLTCANTNDPVPALRIVNTVLARRVAAAGQVTSGTAAGGGADTIVLATGAAPQDGAYTGMLVDVTDGAGAGQTRTVTAYTGASRTATVDAVWATVPDTTSRYSIAPDPQLTVAQAPYPANLPVNLPLVELRHNLTVLDTDLADVIDTLAVPVTAGRAVAATPSTITLDATADGEYPAMRLLLTGGSGAGQRRMITGYDRASRVATLDRPWRVVPEAGDAYRIVDPFGADRERTGLSVEQYDLVSTPVTDPNRLAPYFGLPTLDLAELAKVTVLATRTALTPQGVEDLLYQGIRDGDRSALFINATGEALPPMAIDVASDTITGLSVDRLDRINRFARLATVLGWAFADLQQAMTSVGATAVDRSLIGVLAGIVTLRGATGLGVDELCAWWGDLRTAGTGDLFDRVFNAPAVLAGRDPYTSVTPIPFDPARPLTWDPAGVGGADAVIRARLLAALGVGDDDLTRLAAAVRAAIGTTGPLQLSVPALSRLYRLAAAARAFDLTVEEYLTLLRVLAHPGAAAPAAGPDRPTVQEMLEQHAHARWLRRTGFSPEQLLYVVHGERGPQFQPPYEPDALAPLLASLATAAEPARITPAGLGADGTALFAGLLDTHAVNDLGVVLSGARRYHGAAALFPLDAGSFTGGPISPAQSAEAFAELRAVRPPVILEDGTLSRGFTAGTELSYLFEPDTTGTNRRNQVRAVLQRTRRRIDLAGFAGLLPLTPEAFAGGRVDAASAARAYTALAGHRPPILLPDPAAGQQRLITSYAGSTRTVTLRQPWTVVPGRGARYDIVETVTTGAVQGADLRSVRLDADAAQVDGAYTGMRVRITAGPGAGETGVVLDYDGATRTATIAGAWVMLPGTGSAYEVLSVAGGGRLRGAGPDTAELAADAPATNDVYRSMALVLTPSATLDAGYEPDTDLGFLFDSRGAGQARPVTGYDGATRTVTVAPDWAERPAAGTHYELTRLVHQGTAAGGSPNTIVLGGDAPAVAAGTMVVLLSGPGAGQRATVTAYDAAGHAATVTPPWTTVPDEQSTYEVVAILTAGAARGATAGTLLLDPAADPADTAYDNCTLALVPDPVAPLRRAEVTRVLNATLTGVVDVAGAVSDADALQQGYAAAGLADLLGTTSDRIAALAPAAGADLGEELAALLTPIRDGQVPDPVPGLVARLARALVLFDTLGIAGPDLDAVARLPRAFNLPAARGSGVGFDAVVSLSAFADLLSSLQDTDGALAGYLGRPDDPAWTPGTAPGPKTAALAALTGWPAAQVAALIARLWPAGTPAGDLGPGTVDGVARLARCFDLAAPAGLGMPALERFAALAVLPVGGAGWAAYTEAARLAVDAVGARFAQTGPAEAARAADRLDAARRDALLGYTVWVLGRQHEEIDGPSALYQYLLLDVEQSAALRTSYVAQAIAAVQLYLQRCRLMLEREVTDLSGIPDAWWEWLPAYRVWEANRRVFLYPENYLEPALRRDATPPFEALAGALLENDVTDSTAEAAFRAYFDGFSVVGALVPVDACASRPPRPGTSTLYARGRLNASGTGVVWLDEHASDLRNAYVGMELTVNPGAAGEQRRRITAYQPGKRETTVAPPFAPEAKVGDPYEVTGPKVDELLFLVGRTSADPYTFYTRRHDARTGWQPWQQVDVNIPVPLVTPVYAFDRLMLFWVEQSTVGSSQIRSSKDGGTASEAITVTKASVRFTFRRPDGTWSPPQSAGPDVVTDFEHEHQLDAYVAAALPGLAPMFDPSLPRWRKVYPLHVPAGKVTSPDRYPNGEQVLLTLGPALQTYFNNPLPVPKAPPASAPADQRDFETAARTLVLRNNEFAAANIGTTSLHLPFVPWHGIFGGLTRDPLTATLVDYPAGASSASGWPADHLPVLRRATGRLGLRGSTTWNTILDNYWTDELPGAVDDDVVLLGNANPAAGTVITVKNRPGSFLFDNGDESFLATSTDPGIRLIDEIVTAEAVRKDFPGGQLYLATAPYTTTRTPPTTYAFTRLTSVAARALGDVLAFGGIPALLSRDSQRTDELPFARLAPTDQALPPASDTLDFTGAYGSYLWEVFFHAPFLVARTLTANRRFREARTWLEYIYRPTQQPAPGDEGRQRFWRFLPLRGMDLPTLTQTLADPAQIAAYDDRPFDPHAIARLRISAYAKSVVMRYVDNLLEWADDLFTRDTRESVDEATNLYVLAGDLLGPRPRVVGEYHPPKPATYADIRRAYDDRTVRTGAIVSATATTVVLDPAASTDDDAYTGMYLAFTSGRADGHAGYITAYDGKTQTATLEAPWAPLPDARSAYRIYANGIPQFLIRLENSAPVLAAGFGLTATPFNDIGTYFGVPENDQLVAYWDKVADRLFKIRHGMNIQGVERTLPLFADPVDVTALVRGAAAGGPAPGVAGGVEPAVPAYRFEVVAARAADLAAQVAQLGAQLLSCLEKRDADALAMLRVTQERTLLGLLTSVKEQAVEQCRRTGEALAAGLAGAESRRAYYTGLVDGGLSPTEIASLASTGLGGLLTATSAVYRAVAALAYAIPQGGSPFALTYGGQQLGNVASAGAGALDTAAGVAGISAAMSLTMAQYARREADWQLQADLAGYDVAQITAQVGANEHQLAMAERDLAAHLAAIAQSERVEEFLTGRFAGERLYRWMAGRLSALHFQTYSVALDLARSAQRALQYELGTDTTFVNFGYWDGGRRGLLAGEGLRLALNQMEKAYLDGNVRPLQCTKTVSLAQLDPIALRDLLETGECVFHLSEKLFDDDYPGHYARRISSLAVTIPAVTGPYQNLHATLTQLANQVVLRPDPNAVDFLLGGTTATLPPAGVLRTDWRVNQQIALSHGLGDTGVLDTAGDGRLLPFEGTGAVSTWRLRMPPQSNHFDFDTVSDVIVTLQYQARDGGARFRDQVLRLPGMAVYTGSVRLPLAQVYSSQWYEFLHVPPADPRRQVLRFALADLVPPHVDRAELVAWSLQLRTAAGTAVAGRRPYLDLTLGTWESTRFGVDAAGNHTAAVPAKPRITTVEGAAALAFTLADTPADLRRDGRLDPDVLGGAVLVLTYQGRVDWR
ncbi:neuraminidase-like domain-containing protein [Dactylosporangium siamense]|uniref:Insecticidal toxin complex protein n=1 Tax=Dactylosporangium siamense TaxID=685454 RepID=A0A919PUF4_9ACTN|nr:neuraminidase-like domain-containing protein [Dactylosporangium siamense]GIG49922.1 hypothetical protein Dsi01nite_079630 [Dactylosporangium siamense]